MGLEIKVGVESVVRLSQIELYKIKQGLNLLNNRPLWRFLHLDVNS